MHIESTTQESPYRTGTLKGLTLADIQRMLSYIEPDSSPTADRKVSITWRFLANGKPCGIWNYRRNHEMRGELSTFGPDEIFQVLFGNTYSPI